MKARVKATGLVSEVCPYSPIYLEGVDNCFYPDEVEIVDTISDSPDYWTRLEHQYAGMAMQGMSEKYLKDYRDYCAGFGDMDKDEAKATMKDFADAMADVCYYFAHALVEKYKKEERK